MKYRVFQHIPYVHGHAFDEAAQAVYFALLDNGVDCDFSTESMARDRTNIVFGYHLMARPIAVPHVIFQAEQLAEGRFPAPIEAHLRAAPEVWDYAPENIAFLKERGIAARHVPIGYHERLNRIPRDHPKTTDVLFYGSLNERRRAMLESIKNRGLKVRHFFGLYGADRDAWIAKSKVVLNMHFYPEAILEQFRVAYLLNNGVHVVSEESTQRCPYVCEATVDELAGIVENCVSGMHDQDDQHERFRDERDMCRIMREALA